MAAVPPLITAAYAGLLALMLVALSIRVIRIRRRARIALLDGGDEALRRAIRVQGNFTEYVPMALILMALVEAGGAPGWAIHALGLVLLAGRAAHAHAIAAANLRARVAGMMATFTVLAIAALLAIGQFLFVRLG